MGEKYISKGGSVYEFVFVVPRLQKTMATDYKQGGNVLVTVTERRGSSMINLKQTVYNMKHH